MDQNRILDNIIYWQKSGNSNIPHSLSDLCSFPPLVFYVLLSQLGLGLAALVSAHAGTRIYLIITSNLHILKDSSKFAAVVRSSSFKGVTPSHNWRDWLSLSHYAITFHLVPPKHQRIRSFIFVSLNYFGPSKIPSELGRIVIRLVEEVWVTKSRIIFTAFHWSVMNRWVVNRKTDHRNSILHLNCQVLLNIDPIINSETFLVRTGKVKQINRQKQV